MKNSVRSLNRKTVIFIAAVLAVVAVIFAVRGSYAEFTKSDRAKRVIAAYEAEGQQFSSNYMKTGPAQVDQLLINASGSGIMVPVTVCNYPQNNQGHFYAGENNIEYTLDVSIVDSNGNIVNNYSPQIRVNGAAINNGNKQLSGELESGRVSEETFNVWLPADMIAPAGTKYYVQITATPDGGDLEAISVRLDLAYLTEQLNQAWSILLDDDSNVSAMSYSGYNYRLTGNGDGRIVLTWNTSLIDISKHFKTSVNASDVAGGIAFNVTASAIDSYSIQFYPVSKDAITALTTFDDLNVSCSFEAAQ